MSSNTRLENEGGSLIKVNTLEGPTSISSKESWTEEKAVNLFLRSQRRSIESSQLTDEEHEDTRTDYYRGGGLRNVGYPRATTIIPLVASTHIRLSPFRS